MARTLRIDRIGGWHHVTARGNERRAIWTDDQDRDAFVERLETWAERFEVRLHAYVLMPNHYHLLVELPRAGLSRAMQWLNLSYSAYYNARHRRSGHLFQGRFASVAVDEAEWALDLTIVFSLLSFVTLLSLQGLRAGLATGINRFDPHLFASSSAKSAGRA